MYLLKTEPVASNCLFSSVFLLASCVILGSYFILEASTATSVKWGVYLFHGVFVRVNIHIIFNMYKLPRVMPGNSDHSINSSCYYYY